MQGHFLDGRSSSRYRDDFHGNASTYFDSYAEGIVRTYGGFPPLDEMK